VERPLVIKQSLLIKLLRVAQQALKLVGLRGMTSVGACACMTKRLHQGMDGHGLLQPGLVGAKAAAAAQLARGRVVLAVPLLFTRSTAHRRHCCCTAAGSFCCAALLQRRLAWPAAAAAGLYRKAGQQPAANAPPAPPLGVAIWWGAVAPGRQRLRLLHTQLQQLPPPPLRLWLAVPPRQQGL